MKGEATWCAVRKHKDFNRSGSLLFQCNVFATSISEDEALPKRKKILIGYINDSVTFEGADL